MIDQAGKVSRCINWLAACPVKGIHQIGYKSTGLNWRLTWLHIFHRLNVTRAQTALLTYRPQLIDF